MIGSSTFKVVWKCCGRHSNYTVTALLLVVVLQYRSVAASQGLVVFTRFRRLLGTACCTSLAVNVVGRNNVEGFPLASLSQA